MDEVIANRLLALANKEYALKSARYFKTGPGEYAEHDQFLGIRVPQLRALVKEYRTSLSLADCCLLLQSDWHEFRLFALLVMVELYQRGDQPEKKAVVSRYFKHIKHINNWDLVDASAYKIVGAWHYDKDRSSLDRMIKAASMWHRRVAILSTFYSIKKNDLDDTFRYSKLLLNDSEDLIHKATGWMLREAGKRDEQQLIRFLTTYHRSMPRVMLSYACEKLTAEKRALLR